MTGLPAAIPAIEFNLSSTGMSKGIAQTTKLQSLGRGELALGPLFVGAYAKNVDSSTAHGEAAALVGLRTKAAGLDLAVSAGWKRAINPAPDSDRSALEVNATATRKVGRLIPRLTVAWSPDDLGGTRRTVFAEGGASYSFSPMLSGSAAIGRRERSGGPDYSAWNAGLTWQTLKPLSVDMRYYDTSRGNPQPYRARAVISARAKF